jgi:MoaA/NifB/PqqE/SkfB family radical SAM enzyme
MRRYADRIEDAKNNNGQLSCGPATWEIRASNICNGACLICAPQNSSLIEEQLKANIDKIPRYDQTAVQKLLQSRKQNKSSHLVSEFWKHLGGIERLELNGGEPFLDEQVVMTLKKLIYLKRASQVELLVHTNMTHISEEIVSLLNPFKKVYLRASVDGFASENEHMRWPLKWDDVITGMNIVEQNLSKEHYKTLSGTLSVYNCMSLDKVYEWIATDFPNWQVDFAIAYYPRRFSVAMISLDRRVDSARRVEKIVSKMCNETQKNWPKIKSFLLMNQPAQPEQLSDFIEYTLAMDQIRNQNTLSVFPHLREIFEKVEIKN